jgi:hypothetical protein
MLVVQIAKLLVIPFVCMVESMLQQRVPNIICSLSILIVFTGVTIV